MSETPESTPAETPSQLPMVIQPPATLYAEKVRVPQQQLGDLAIDELEAVAEEFGLDSSKYKDKASLVAAIHARRQLIASLDRPSMRDVLDWAGRGVMPGVTNEQMAIEIVHVRSMRFSGLSERGLVVLCLLRSASISGRESRDDLIYALKRQEGFFAKMKRKTRGWVGKRMEKMMGDPTTAMPEATAEPINKPTDQTAGPRQQALREEIEESGFFGGIANRVKKQADSYVNQKLDEIESRIDRKLDEIDRRLAEWRDKEIANRIRILKITLWASIVVAAVSLIYSYVQVEMKRWNQPTNMRPSTTPTTLVVPNTTTNLTATTIATRMSQSSPT